MLAGYDEAGGGKGYMPVDHSQATEVMGGRLSNALRASWLPKITNGWFFRAESFFSVARYLDLAAREVGQRGPDFLSHSHGEGFLLMRRMDNIGHCQIIMATHSPMLMAYPNARLLRLTKYGLEPVTVKETDHYKVMREFCDDPTGFVEAAIEE